MKTNVIHTGDCLEALQRFPDGCVNSVMTSPPYWNLRDYGEADQLGLEDTPEEFVENLAAVFDEVKRVLRDDGSLWLNLGDTYDNKDLQQIPARVALELQDRGWILRNRVTWAKPNPMPQSVKDRLNDTTEAIFHFVKNKDYWYDLDAIREPHKSYDEMVEAENTGRNNGIGKDNPDKTQHQLYGHTSRNEHAERGYHTAGKNPGDVFEVTTKPFPDAHFAVYPPELCEKPIKATAPPQVCVECGAPYEREVERQSYPGEHKTKESADTQYNQEGSKRNDAGRNLGGRQYRKWKKNNPDEFKGWTPTCDCDTDATESGIVLDPFAGAGTTLLKAKDLGRRFVGIELNPEYADMARARIGLSPHDPANVRDDEEQNGLEAYQ